MDAAVISKMLEVDPAFGDFLDRLDGVSKMNDPSETHVNSTQKQGDSKKKLAGGLLFGSAAEATATSRAVQSAFGGGEPKPPRTKLGGALHRVAETPGGKKGEAAMQVANLAVGLGAARELLKKPSQQGVSKSIAGHIQPISLVQSNARFKAIGIRAPQAPRPGVASRVGTQPNRGHVSLAKGATNRAVRGAARAARRSANAQARAVREHPDFATGYGAGRAQGQADGRATLGQFRATRKRNVRRAAVSGAVVGAAGGGTLAVVGQRRLQPHIEAYQRGQQTEVAKNVEWAVPISKVNVEKRQVFGWASLSMVDGEPVADRQGDYIPIDEAETSAYRYMLNSRKGGDMHRRVSKLDAGPVHTSDVIESMVFTPEKLEALGLEPDALPLGWWLGVQIHDDQQWEDVKTGKRTGFSVHGSGVRKEYVG